MSINIQFTGNFTLNSVLQDTHFQYFQRFSAIAHRPLRVEALAPYSDPLRERVGLPLGPYGIYFTGVIDPFGLGDDVLVHPFVHIKQLTPERLTFLASLELLEQPYWSLLSQRFRLNPPFFEKTSEQEAQKWQATLNMRKSIPVLLPSSGCDWTPTLDKKGIEVRDTDRFPRYKEWLQFLLDHFLIPWDYELAGQVEYQTEWGQQGYFLVEQGRVREVITQPSRPY